MPFDFDGVFVCIVADAYDGDFVTSRLFNLADFLYFSSILLHDGGNKGVRVQQTLILTFSTSRTTAAREGYSVTLRVLSLLILNTCVFIVSSWSEAIVGGGIA